MKKLLLILLTFISLNTFAQMKVKEGSFKHIPNAIMNDKYDHLDGNDLPMALIKISTENIPEQERLRLKFSGNLATQITKTPKTGQMWIYISAENATFINIMHPDYGTCKYYLPEKLCDFCTYEMVLQYVPIVAKEEQLQSQKAHLIIKADQDDAVIYIDDQPISTKETSKLFEVGTTHTWMIKCNMYHTESGTVTLNERTVIDKKLCPNFGYLNISTSPEQGAKVFVDEEFLGISPIKTGKLRSGSHTVKVMMDMYKMKEETFTITDGETINANIKMSANFVNVTISTDVQSDIYIDEEYKGKGSWSGRLSDGDHILEARKNNHKTSKKSATLVLGKTQNIQIDAPKPINGSLEINTTPMEADIYIDGNKYGETPNYISEILIGEHELKFIKQGCAELKKTIFVEEGKLLSINEILETGKEVSINTGQTGDLIYVDGEYVGISPVTINLPYGTHSIKATRGKQITTKDIEIKADKSKNNVYLEFGEIVNISSTSPGDKVFVNGKKVGVTPLNLDLSLGTYDVKVKRGNKYETRTLQVNRNGTNSFYFFPKKETYSEYMSNGVHFITLDTYYYTYNNDEYFTYFKYSGFFYGLTYGMCIENIIGWSVSISQQLVMANFMIFCTEYGLGVSNNGLVLNIGLNVNLKRITLNADLGCNLGVWGNFDSGYFIKFGLGYNFKRKK